MAELEDWTPEQVSAALEAGEIVLIDVRTPPEYMIEHVDGALLAPMSGFRADALPDQKGKRIVLHCGSGMRSGAVARKAMEAGVAPLAHMAGGFAAWKAAGLPYVGTELSTGVAKTMRQS